MSRLIRFFMVLVCTIFVGFAHAAYGAEFTVVTMPDTKTFTIEISAAGTFQIDWGDGSAVQTVNKGDTTNTPYSHTYVNSGEYTIGISGDATEYNTATYVAAIRFSESAANVAAIGGSLGAVFGVLGDGASGEKLPRFINTFSNCTNLTVIPAGVFDGLTGTPVPHMFNATFRGCSGLTAIPANLFSGFTGEAPTAAFKWTFEGCSGLKSLPAGLFSGITGQKWAAFEATFQNCTNLSGYVDGNMWKPGVVVTSGTTFEGTNLMTTCPANTYAVTKPNTAWDVAVCDPCPDGMISVSGSTSVDACIMPLTPEFTITTTPDTEVFEISISAAGYFEINWGDGTDVQLLIRKYEDKEVYSHTYKNAGEYKITIAGDATAYNDSIGTAAISFVTSVSNIADISGSLGAIFGTLPDGTNPRFYKTFNGATNLTSLPDNLFDGISGAPIDYMFYYTFDGCSGLTEIPAGLFAGLDGVPNKAMFHSTFANCTGLQLIPGNLFSGVSGAPAGYMFANTFINCSNLTTIPDNLFSGINGNPAEYMFYNTFSGCDGLVSVPANLFSGIDGNPADLMFYGTFDGCQNLMGYVNGDMFPIPAGDASKPYSYTFIGADKMDTTCPVATYAVAKPDESWSVAVCSSCPDGQISPAGSTSIDACYAYTPCNANSYYDIDSATCVSCPDTHPLSDADALSSDKCYATVTCDAGTYYNTISSSCVTCMAGAYCMGGDVVVNYNGTATGAGTVASPCPENTISQSGAETVAACKTLDPQFAITTIPDVSYFNFYISAAGIFHINWGDGKTDTIVKTDTTKTKYSHSYDVAGEYKIGIGGMATAYNTSTTIAAISFNGNGNIAGISGSLGAIFPTLANGDQPVFYQTFYDCHNLTGSIPAELFSGITGNPVENMFYQTFYGCYNLTGSIPAELFSGITGNPAPYMFYQTFKYCYGLTGYVDASTFLVPAGNVYSPYSDTFYGNSDMTTICPSGTYIAPKPNSSWSVAVCSPCPDGKTSPLGAPSVDYCVDSIEEMESEFIITTTPDTSSFHIRISAAGTFQIDWGDGTIEPIVKVDTTVTLYTHNYDMAGEYKIGIAGDATAYGSIAAISLGNDNFDYAGQRWYGRGEYIADISGSLGAIFGTLPDGTNPRFYQTFYDCYRLTGSIPAELFSGITGNPVENMFYQTFYDCSRLTGSIPAELFSGITGNPASYMFYQTFYDCYNLTGSIPAELFSGITGNPAPYMFYQTFMYCSNLTGYVDASTFLVPAGNVYSPYSDTFYGNSDMTTICPSGTYMAPKPDSSWSVAVCSPCPDGKTSMMGATSVDACVDSIEEMEPEFTITTTPDTSNFNLAISAAGTFQINWGDGNIDTIVRTDTTKTRYSHGYDVAGEYQISIAGDATAYATGYNEIAAISFNGNRNIAGISGSLGAIFPTLANGDQPVFYQTFYYCDNMTGSIPAELFSGITGTPSAYMFNETFALCSKLSGNIPASLFSGLSGDVASHMFYRTFYNCSNLTGYLDANTFATLTGNASYAYSQTFSDSNKMYKICPVGTYVATKPDNSWSVAVCSVCPDSSSDVYIEECVNPQISEFNVTIAIDARWLSFEISAAGTYTIDWGDGSEPQEIVKSDTSNVAYSHIYPQTGTFVIGLSGDATGYNAETYVPAVRFANLGEKVIAVSGRLSDVFPVLSDGTLPRFYQTFQGCSNLASIPNDLFSGIAGAPGAHMFNSTFLGCSSLTEIPENLFSEIRGAPTTAVFNSTFKDCVGLTSVPETLFSGISGKPAYAMFNNTFSGCSNLTGYVSGNMFQVPENGGEGYYTNTFANADKMDTTCPGGTYPVQKPDKSWTVAVCLPCTDDMVCPEPEITPSDAEFIVTTTADTTSFEFNLSAAGTFRINWGDGVVEEIHKIDTNVTTYTHDYDTADEYTIGISGDATAYNVSDEVAAISFENNQNVAAIDGQLGNVFGQIGGTQPRFASTFKGCKNLTGYVNGDLFPASGTASYKDTFEGATNMDTQCPENTYGVAKPDPDWSVAVCNSCPPETSSPAGSTSIDACVVTFSPDFTITTMDDTSEFSLDISAKGVFKIDWGDGNKVQVIIQPDIENNTYSHKYDVAGKYDIKMSGQVTEYNRSIGTAAISFANSAPYIQAISGSLGSVFKTLDDGTQPLFYKTFFGCSNLKSIPSDLFRGVYGEPVDYMFYHTFEGCSGLTEIPAGLFGDIHGAPKRALFHSTFAGCSGLESIPGTLFAGIKLDPAEYMFAYTFKDCLKLTQIPDTLFDGIKGVPAEGMFYFTFNGCAGLEYIPDTLFSGIAGVPKKSMFNSTFAGCSSLKEIPVDLFRGIGKEPAPYMFASTFMDCASLKEIPKDLFIDIEGAPADYMFYQTFARCSGVSSIDKDLFVGIHGAPATAMFDSAFARCSNLTEIPEDLFAGIKGAPADYMFSNTFSYCSRLTSVPKRLFRGISGEVAADKMFYQTFFGCGNLLGYVDGGMFTVPAGDAAEPYRGTFFEDKKMDTKCPGGTYGVDKPDPGWTVAVCVPCPNGAYSPEDSFGIEACRMMCGFELRAKQKDKTIVIPLWAVTRDTPAVEIYTGDTTCYMDIDVDDKTGKFYIPANVEKIRKRKR